MGLLSNLQLEGSSRGTSNRREVPAKLETSHVYCVYPGKNDCSQKKSCPANVLPQGMREFSGSSLNFRFMGRCGPSSIMLILVTVCVCVCECVCMKVSWPMFMGSSLINHPWWGTPILGNPHITIQVRWHFQPPPPTGSSFTNPMNDRGIIDHILTGVIDYELS